MPDTAFHRDSSSSHHGEDFAPSSVQRVEQAIEYAKHYLPTQGPISIFVHHNTLHAFEHLSFDEAVIEGGRLYHCEPYLAEDRYRLEVSRGRITIDDLRQVLMDDLDDAADELIAGFGTRYTLRLAMLQMTLHQASEAELQWLLAETDLLKRFQPEISLQRREYQVGQTRTWALRNQLVSQTETQSWSDAQWEAFTLRTLWRVCRQGVGTTQYCRNKQNRSLRLRDLLLETTGEDVDTFVNDVMIRFCGGFLDQGLADWTLPHRDEGFAQAFARLYAHPLTVNPNWMQGIRNALAEIPQGKFDPLDSIVRSLAAQGVAADQFDQAIRTSLLTLRGWAGMVWQAETNASSIVRPIRSGSLVEYLAIRLIVENLAIADIGARHFGEREIVRIAERGRQQWQRRARVSIDEQTFTIFQLAQAGGWTPEQLSSMSSAQWTCLAEEIDAFHAIQRRRLLHAAYERHYQTAALDALAIHCSRWRRTRPVKQPLPAFAAVFCIDDREESFRRHLEEVDPECVTSSAAGFFAVAMYYQGADHAHYRPLCPAPVTPRHYVREEPLFSAVDVGQRRAQRRRHLGQVTHQVHAHSRTMLGGWFTGVFGAVATFPMVARIMAPRLTSKIREQVGSLVRPPATELHLEREADEPGSTPESLGYSLDEMADIVVRILQDIGMVKDFPPLVLFFGHGSSSLNNPHESAYNCGACSGGRGGPNARAFAVMANDPRVRKRIETRGITLSEDVRFVGAYHNTCNDHVEYYDLDALPRTHRGLFRRIEQSVDQARARNAHERARRFESAPLDLSPTAALEHVEQRAEDLSQARPEYNHATNALVIVGRRDWTRGLFMDRRAFLTQYDPSVDDENATILNRILQAAIPVCAGISLEYYFSTVDVEGYGCGSKLPHNVASMIGVMTGAASDLRPGLSQQMVEIHEPMRITFVLETTPETINRIIDSNPPIARLVRGGWVHVALIDPETSSILRYVDGRFEPYIPESNDLPEVASSMDWYRGQREHLGFASIQNTSESSAWAT
ncbi:MAG: DUF2309 domain-containing protein [Pirellulaceae bacterium]